MLLNMKKWKLAYVKHSGAEIGIFWDKQLNNMDSDAQVICIAIPSAVIIINCVQYGYSESEYQETQISHWWGMMGNENIYLMFSHKKSALWWLTNGKILQCPLSEHDASCMSKITLYNFLPMSAFWRMNCLSRCHILSQRPYQVHKIFTQIFRAYWRQLRQLGPMQLMALDLLGNHSR